MTTKQSFGLVLSGTVSVFVFLVLSGVYITACQKQVFNEFKSRMSALQSELVPDTAGEIQQLITEVEQSVKKTSRRLGIVQSIGAGAGILLLGFAFFRFSSFIRHLTHCTTLVSQMGKGDLTCRFQIPVKSENQMDELQLLENRLNLFAGTIQKNIKEIAVEAQALNKSSAGMNKAARDLTGQSDRSADRSGQAAGHATAMSETVNGVAAAMEELSTSTSQMSQSTAFIADKIGRAHV